MALFLDSNVPMYAGGADHPLRAPCLAVLELLAHRPTEFVTSAEVFQEILYRFLAQRRWDIGRAIHDRFVQLMEGRVVAVQVEDVVRAAELAETVAQPDARDLVHAAVMERIGCTHIVSADRGFDTIPGVERLDPLAVHEWRSLVEA